jgi:tetratricopeptide (TPR) repeat protein
MGTNSNKQIWQGVRSTLLALTVGWLMAFPLMGGAQQEGAAELFKQAKVLEDAQNYAAAESLYLKVLASDPDNSEALKRLGILEQTDMKLDDSIAHFKRVLAAHPDYPEVNFYLGLSYYGKHDFPNAIASLQQEAKTPTAHLATQYYMALALESDGRTDEAIDQLNVAGARNPKKADVFFELARLHMGAAFQAYTTLRKIDPDCFQIHAFNAALYYQEAKYPEAIAEYQTALKKQPDAPGIHASLGVAYYMLHQTEMAEKEFLLAFQQDPENSVANVYLGDIAMHRGEFSKALPYLQQATASQPKNVEAHLLLGRCYLRLGDLAKAKAELLVAAGLDPADPRSHYMLAEIYQKLNQPAERQAELDLVKKLSAEQDAKLPVGAAKESAPTESNNP